MSEVHKLITDHLDIWTAADAEKKSVRGRAAGNANSVYGIKKLRELILELAMRGKLVPQDPNDEPACKLLIRLTDGNRRNKKIVSTSNSSDEFPFEAPRSWEWTTLGDIGQTHIGLTYSPKDISENGVPVLRSSNVQNGKIDLSDLVRVNIEIRENLFVDNGDLIICARNGSKALVGKTAMIKDIAEPTTFGAFMAIYKSPINEFVEVFLNSPIFRRGLDGVATTTINQITQNNLKATLLPIPPITEQQRIVTKVDELMALCDQLEQQHNNAAEAHEQLVSHLLGTLTQSQDPDDFNANWQRIADHFDTLFTTESSIEALKQTILQLAVMGKLVRQDPNDEPASELLKRIQAEKAKLVAEGKIKKEKPLTEICDDEKLFDVPIGWALVRKAAVFKFLNGYAFKSETFQSSGVKLLRNVNISHGFVDWRDVEHISNTQAEEFEEYSLNDGDTVLTLDRPIITTGLKFAVISKSDLPCLLLQRVAKISSFSESVISNYLSIWLQSAFFTSKIDPGRSNGVPHISTTQVSNMLFALPPVAEQHRIVNKVNKVITLCDQLKLRITSSNQIQEKLANVLVEKSLVM